MDQLNGLELERFSRSALHYSRMPQVKYGNSGAALFEEVEDHNAAHISDFAGRRARTASLDRRLASFGGTAMGGDVNAAIPRFYSPRQYFEQTQVPFDIKNDKHRLEMYNWFELFYETHPLIPILVDIFTRFPLVGMELDSPDSDLRVFYEDLFFEDLKYDEFLVDVGREYWTLGQSWALGHFNETMGVWEEEELLDPKLVNVKKFPIIGKQQFFLTPPPELVKIVKDRKPEDLYYLLARDHEDLLPYFRKNEPIPVSDVLLKQIAFKTSPRNLHGTPILLRALRQLLHEEKLMAAQDAIAERLYSPLLLVKLGVQDMGANRPPWIPGPEHVAALRNDLDLALSSDFRMLVHHFGIEVQNVWGREQMPRLDPDFDRVDKKIMQTFGVNPNLLSGGASAQPYASSALQAEFLNQILRTYQRYLKRHYEARAKIVAEAQGHWAYEKRGDTRIPIMEEVLEIDPDTGDQMVVLKKKLMIPELRMKVLDLRDEATQRQYLQALKQQGVPIPDEDLSLGMPYVFPESLAKVQEELIQKTVSQQDAKVKTYDILKARGLPIPPDLKQEIEGMEGFQPPQPGDTSNIDIQPPMPGEDITMPPPPDDGATPAIGPYNPQRGERPEQSDERSPISPNGPSIPGVPGQPGMLGIPGAPKPAIGPGGTTSSVFRSNDGVDYIIGKRIAIAKHDVDLGGIALGLTNEDESATMDEDGITS
jgi:hypothetical protein